MIGLGDVLNAGALPGPLQALFSRDADVTFNFTVLIGKPPVMLPWGDFYSVEGLTRTFEPESYKELGRHSSPRQLIGDGSYGHVTLKWGMMNRSQLWDWTNMVAVGGASVDIPLLGSMHLGTFRKNVMIIQMNRGKIPLRIYSLKNCWPVRWSGANLDAMSSTTAVEELELVYEHLDVMAIPLPF